MRILIIAVGILPITGLAIAAGLNFTTPLPDPTRHTVGAAETLAVDRAALQEIRTKMTNWAAFTGYSSGTTR